jgi:hypothetical protein
MGIRDRFDVTGLPPHISEGGESGLAIDKDAPTGMKIAGYYMHHVDGAIQLQRYSEKPFLDALRINQVDILNKVILPVSVICTTQSHTFMNTQPG